MNTQKGYAFKSKWYQKEGIAVVRVSDFTDNSISSEAINYISEEIAQKYTRYQLKKWDIIVQTVGSWQHNPASIVGKVICVPEALNNALLNQNAVKIIPEILIDKRFLYYRLKDDHFKLHNLNHAQGAANQASITLDSIRRFKFLIPPLPTQRKIASILSAYDDLIENNLKRIKFLEEKAQLTYEEWFIRMKFPGWEKVKVDEERGLPEGWEEKKLGEYIVLNYGKALKASTRIKGDYNVYGSSGIVGTHNGYLVNGPGVIVGRKGNVGSVFWEENAFYPIDTVYYISSDVSYYFIYYNLKNQNFVNNDSAVPGLNRNSAYLKASFIPTQGVLDEFENYVKPLFDSIQLFQNQNQLLKEARDLLLPRLMMGMIDVEEMELETFKITR